METTLDWGDVKLVDHEESETWNYLPKRSVRSGEKIRLGAGPYYVDPEGNKHSFGEKGVFLFLRHGREIVNGKLKAEYLVLSGDTGSSVIVILNQKKSRYGARIRYRPYRISKVRG